MAVLAALAGMATVGVRLRGRGPARAPVSGNLDAQLQTAGTAAPTTTVVPTLPATTAAPPTTARALPVPTTARPAARVPAAPAARAGGGVFAGLGTWVDAFDFDPAHTGGHPTVAPADVDRMAAAGVSTLYLQASRSEDPAAPGPLVAPDLLGQFLRRAHGRGLRVVAWYLPHLGDVGDDQRRVAAIAGFTAGGRHFDGLGLDIEWTASVPDPSARSARLVDLVRRLPGASGDLPLGAIVLPPVVTDVLNTNYWPGFPWRSIAGAFGAWLPMDYWTNRSPDSPYRDAYRYTADNVAMVREHLGQPGAAVHAVGGIGNAASLADYQRFRAACVDTGTVGRSVYDWATTEPVAWPALRG